MMWVTLYKNIYFHLKSVQNIVIAWNVVPAGLQVTLTAEGLQFIILS